MIMKHLKQATSARHAALEGRLPLLDPALSRADYRSLLNRFLGYYAPLEERLQALPHWNDLDFNYAQRTKAPCLARDLIALGTTPDELARVARCPYMPPVTSVARLLGCLYVIEGATLGGQIITRRLHASLRLTPASGAAFLNGYGVHTGERWKAFCAMATTVAQRTGRDEDILASANLTFDTLDQWLFPASATAGPT